MASQGKECLKIYPDDHQSGVFSIGGFVGISNSESKFLLDTKFDDYYVDFMGLGLNFFTKNNETNFKVVKCWVASFE